jgi:hypothetical protein
MSTEIGAGRFKVHLADKQFIPPLGIESGFAKRLRQATRHNSTWHVYVQLRRHVSMEEHAELKELGLDLLSYIGANLWRAGVSNPEVVNYLSNEVEKPVSLLRLVRWIGEINSADRINPKVFDQDSKLSKNGLTYFITQFHEDVPLIDAVRIVEKAGGQSIKEIKALHAVQVKGTRGMVQELMKHDTVKWIDHLPPAPEVHLDEVRAAMNIDAVHDQPVSLDGTGIRIGQWDIGNADPIHADINGRVTIYEAQDDDPVTHQEVSDHATWVAGIMIGDGSLSESPGGATAYQWRGVAPNAEVISFNHTTDAEIYATDVSQFEPEYSWALSQPNPIRLSNNSWSPGTYFHDGEMPIYDFMSAFYDHAVSHGGYGLPVITTAGNEGPDISGVPWSTLAISNSAKNVIQVGNAFPPSFLYSDWYTTGTSSRGPTADGRLKPDVVAPGDERCLGCGVTSTIPFLYIDEKENLNCAPTTFSDIGMYHGPAPNSYGDDYCYPYETGQGTSASAPATSGVVALLLQKWRESYLQDPWPSTVKGILVHTAGDITGDEEDLAVDYTGPDYFSGYGHVDAQLAIMQIDRPETILQRTFDSRLEDHVYDIEVPDGASRFKITLVWDDMPANANDIAQDILKNDLDLLLISPGEQRYYPPWELDPDNPALPAVRSSYTSEAAADSHRDSLNVVEQVVVDNPDPGLWKVKIKPQELPHPPQRYSVIADYDLWRSIPELPPPFPMIPRDQTLRDALNLLDCAACPECLGKPCDPRVNRGYDIFWVLEDDSATDPATDPALVSFRHTQLGLKDNDRPLKAAAPLEGWNKQSLFVASVPYADTKHLDAGCVIIFNRSGATVARIDGVTQTERLGIDMDVRGNEIVVASTRRILRLDRGQIVFDMDLDLTSAERQGIQVAFTQDIDGDKRPEILLGLPYAESGGISESGQIRVIGSRMGELLDIMYGQSKGQHLGALLQSIQMH